MGLSSVLSSANLGLGLTQSALDVVARNIANADTPGYTRKVLQPTELVSNGEFVGFRDLELTRTVDKFLQAQIRVESAAFNNADIRHDFLDRINQLFGAPGSATALDTLVNNFSGSLQQLTGSPDSFAVRTQAVGDAEVLAQQLRQLTSDVQSLRQLAEDTLASDIDQINQALQSLAAINQQFTLGAASSAPSPDLLDERDKFINQIAQFIEISVTERDNGSVVVTGRAGNVLLDHAPVTFTFDHRGDISAQSVYSTTPADRGVGTVSIVSSGGSSIDLIQNNALRTGRIGALVELRDTILVETQAQLDELAHGLALAFADNTVAGTAAVVGAQQGFDVDLTGLQPGNAISLAYTTTPPGTQQTVTIVRVDDASQLPLSNNLTPDPNDTVLGIDFSGGTAAAAAAIDAALGAAVTVSNPSGNTLRILDDGAPNTTDINALSATITATAVQDGGLALPLFIDGGSSPVAYTASLEGGPQKLGFAGRLTVNSLVVQDNELLVRHSTSPLTPLGDPDRPVELLARLSDRQFSFSPASGIGSTQNPFQSTVLSFVERVITEQTGQADRAGREKAAQDVVLGALQGRFQADTGVDINQELSELITLQNAFAANARIVQMVDEMMQLLLRI